MVKLDARAVFKGPSKRSLILLSSKSLIPATRRKRFQNPNLFIPVHAKLTRCLFLSSIDEIGNKLNSFLPNEKVRRR